MSSVSPPPSAPGDTAPETTVADQPGALLARLWRDFLSRYTGRLVLAFAAMIVLAVTVSLIPLIIEAINAALLTPRGATGSYADQVTTLRAASLLSPDLDTLIAWGPFVLPLVGLVYAGAQYTQSRLSLSAAYDTLRDIQTRLFDHFLTLDLSQQRAEPSGALASRFTNDIQIMRETLTRVTNGARDGLQALGLIGVMIFYDGFLLLAIVGVYALAAWPLARLGKSLRRAASRAQASTADLSAQLVQQVAGATMVKSYQLEDSQRTRLGTLFDQRTATLKRAGFLRAMNEPLIFFVGTIAIGFVVIIIGLRIKSGALDAPAVAGFIVALLLLSQPARGLSTLYAVVQEGMAAFGRVTHLLDRTAHVHAAPGATPLQIKQAGIAFEDISFAYDTPNRETGENTPALRDVSFTVAPGQTVAIVGASGAGKSTVLSLLQRFYDPQHGRILIDGQDIHNYTLESVRRAIAFVSQDPVLFQSTIAENIGFGRAGATRAHIEAAAKNADADDFIRALSAGYETGLAEAGASLSGGQRQRLALARAFLKDAPILLLDEPTAALDAASEDAVKAALTRLTAGRTTLIVAHRLSTIRDADMILVMDQGRMVERGTHDTLKSENGPYADFLRRQNAAPIPGSISGP
ncbi:MAG: ABC transporter ATP-binding protein, partial [Pseudomonadota bacterium]